MLTRRHLIGILAGLSATIVGRSGFAADRETFADWVRVLYQGALALREAGSALSDQDIQMQRIRTLGAGGSMSVTI